MGFKLKGLGSVRTSDAPKMFDAQKMALYGIDSIKTTILRPTPRTGKQNWQIRKNKDFVKGEDWLFIGNYPTGKVYADRRWQEKSDGTDGWDYVEIFFQPYNTADSPYIYNCSLPEYKSLIWELLDLKLGDWVAYGNKFMWITGFDEVHRDAYLAQSYDAKTLACLSMDFVERIWFSKVHNYEIYDYRKIDNNPFKDKENLYRTHSKEEDDLEKEIEKILSKSKYAYSEVENALRRNPYGKKYISQKGLTSQEELKKWCTKRQEEIRIGVKSDKIEKTDSKDLSDAVSFWLDKGIKFNANKLKSLANEFGLTNPNEIIQQAELGVVKSARKIANNGESLRVRFEKIRDIYDLQPTISPKDGRANFLQQFSTPAPIAFLAGEFVNFNSKHAHYLEPSAGNGMLTIALPVDNTWVNDLDDVRYKNLLTQGFVEVTNLDASTIRTNNQFNGVITNPPFGRLSKKDFLVRKGRKGNKEIEYTFEVLDHKLAILALENMADNGRCAIIVGGKLASKMYDHKKAFWKDDRLFGDFNVFVSYLNRQYNLIDILYISGDLYAKQGTTYPIVMLLIDGRKKWDAEPTAIWHKYDEKLDKPIESLSEYWDRMVGYIEKQETKQAPVQSSLVTFSNERVVKNYPEDYTAKDILFKGEKIGFAIMNESKTYYIDGDKLDYILNGRYTKKGSFLNIWCHSIYDKTKEHFTKESFFCDGLRFVFSQEDDVIKFMSLLDGPSLADRKKFEKLVGDDVSVDDVKLCVKYRNKRNKPVKEHIIQFVDFERVVSESDYKFLKRYGIEEIEGLADLSKEVIELEIKADEVHHKMNLVRSDKSKFNELDKELGDLLKRQSLNRLKQLEVLCRYFDYATEYEESKKYHEKQYGAIDNADIEYKRKLLILAKAKIKIAQAKAKAGKMDLFGLLGINEETFAKIETTNGELLISSLHGKIERDENVKIATYLCNRFGFSIILLSNKNDEKSADSYNKTLQREEEYKTPNGSKSSVDRVIRDGSKQADYLVIRILNDFDYKIISKVVHNRVKRTENIIGIMFIDKDFKTIRYTREEIIDDEFEIKKEDFV